MTLVHGYTNPTNSYSDVCIVGSGPAGLSLAMKLAASGLSVDIIESGLEDPTEQSESLNSAESDGIPYVVGKERRRAFGGSSHCWSGWCSPLSEEDFVARPWMATSEWPISFLDYAAYHPEAKVLLNIGDGPFDARYWAERMGRPIVAFLDAIAPVEPHAWLISTPTSFAARFRAAIQDSSLLRCCLGATVLRVRCSRDRRTVIGLDVSNPDGNIVSARARTYVLALGGIENARLLLLSNDVEETGLLNGNDLVGRYFFEHSATYSFGTVFVDNRNPLGMPFIGGHTVFPSKLSSDGTRPPEGGFGFGWRLKASVQHQQKLPQCWMVVSEPPPIAHPEAISAAAILHSTPESISVVPIAAAFETKPRSESRVTLSEKIDLLGQRKANLTWTISDDDRILGGRAFSLIARWLKNQRGLVLIEGDDPTALHWQPVGGAHHIGTTRMSNDARRGIVDSNLLAHGFDNLFICGSSVFPSNTFGNPTFPIVCLSLRLADHIMKNIRHLGC